MKVKELRNLLVQLDKVVFDDVDIEVEGTGNSIAQLDWENRLSSRYGNTKKVILVLTRTRSPLEAEIEDVRQSRGGVKCPICSEYHQGYC